MGAQGGSVCLDGGGVAILGYCVAVYLYAEYYQLTKSREFTRELRLDTIRTAASGPPLAAIAPPEDGGVLGRLEIPRLHLSVMVLEGVDDRDLRRAAGHIPGTALPGEPGNIGIAAHRDTFFRPLRRIRPGDIITLATLAGTYHYHVVSTTIVLPEDFEVLHPEANDTLTLVTCFPFYYIGSAPDRFIVRAEKSPGV
jgi:sortase A